MSTQRRYSDEDLRAAVEASESIAGVLRRLGIKPAGGSHFHISKRIKGLSLDTTHFTGQGHNRGKNRPRLTAEEILTVKREGIRRTSAKLLRRAMMEVGVPHACVGCGTGSTWYGRHLTLHVDHIDGDYGNCLLENLRFLCPNCHSQTATYCRTASSRRTACSA